MEYVYGFMAVLFVSHLRVLWLHHNLSERVESIEAGWDQILIESRLENSWLTREFKRIKELMGDSHESNEGSHDC